MIVDDEPFNHECIKIILKPIVQIEIVSAFNGLEALNMIKNADSPKEWPHVIFMDVDMPILNGITVQ